MNKVTEKELDKAIDDAFKYSKKFSSWFLSKTKFSNKFATYYWSRSDHPWGPVPITVQNPKTGDDEQTIMESETDVLVVFEAKNNERFALHIENKLAKGKFTPFQPELYAQRAELWQGDPRYGEYTDYETVLISPLEFYELNKEDVAKFDRYLSHEEISEYIPAFAQ